MFVRAFGELSKADVPVAGGKGASLGEMMRGGFTIPPGFVILSTAFDALLDESGLRRRVDSILKEVRIEDAKSVEEASRRIRKLILSAKVPRAMTEEIKTGFAQLDSPYVAIRSSATAEDSASAAWAGQLESYLNTTQKSLILNVKRCWASLFTPRAIFYRLEKGLASQRISVAVIVQRMAEPEVSGIAFSVHPVTQDRNCLIIEAGYGLGEAIVSGQITPDSYVVEKKHLNIEERRVETQARALTRGTGAGNRWVKVRGAVAGKQKLTDTNVRKLAKTILEIEAHYGFPCDIEWALENGSFYILQSRPITTLADENRSSELDRAAMTTGRQGVSVSKYMSREISLFYTDVWNEGEIPARYVAGTTLETMLFLRGRTGMTDIYYAPYEMERNFGLVCNELERNQEAITEIISEFRAYFNKLLPYLEGRAIRDTEELKQYHDDWATWWSIMSYVWVIPQIEDMPKGIRNQALKERERTQKYSDALDKPFLRFVRDNYPKYAAIADLLTPVEAYSLGSLPPQKIKGIQARRKGCALLTINGRSSLVSLKVAKKRLERNGISILKPKIDAADGLKGMVASPGVAKGRVRLVLSKSDLKHVRKGEIMVTYATSPDYIPAMGLCSAIVTNEGGQVCHAAIVSRELGIPCIVGTRVGTEVLKTGDTVEVDAIRGMIRIVDASIG
ncbi:MAG: hypothetical protein KGH94_04560 [Candidatus Micrarchaeota archaeon]|nr:hypothetical protein [Candidatus Micrarchaeota archaeon]